MALCLTTKELHLHVFQLLLTICWPCLVNHSTTLQGDKSRHPVCVQQGFKQGCWVTEGSFCGLSNPQHCELVYSLFCWLWLFECFPMGCIVSMFQGRWWAAPGGIPSPISDLGHRESWDLLQGNVVYSCLVQGIVTLLGREPKQAVGHCVFQTPQSGRLHENKEIDQRIILVGRKLKMLWLWKKVLTRKAVHQVQCTVKATRSCPIK